MTLRLGAETVRAHPLARIVGVAGLLGTVLLFAALIAGSPGEPPPDATTAEAAQLVRGLDGSTEWQRGGARPRRLRSCCGRRGQHAADDRSPGPEAAWGRCSLS